MEEKRIENLNFQETLNKFKKDFKDSNIFNKLLVAYEYNEIFGFEGNQEDEELCSLIYEEYMSEDVNIALTEILNDYYQIMIINRWSIKKLIEYLKENKEK